ncbi:lysM domain receptor-like kinase 10 [Corylus avellana]|uniref:lysM domain receptor-like kinase 10 n=1 Tax=Corylus avellana TaxID=13451 RepID=UPI00286A9D97|nr:lysM domain receptor-like kinase 10 [Corylus avellana]
MDLSILKVATDNFSDAHKLGEGGFGPVYKGKLLDGREIAVKRLSRSSAQGLEELRTEVLLVAKLLHRNPIRLLGFCLEEEEKLLVYEYLPNGSLDKFLFDQSQRFYLEWERRSKIIVGIARGLLYLHEDSQLKIIHRDLKASNILLDECMNPKISNFGLARLIGGSHTHANTNRIAGTQNQAVHNGVIPEASQLAAKINRISLEHHAAWTPSSKPVRELWSPPPTGIFKVNFDTAIRESFSVQAAVCRNSNGQIIKILSQVRPPCNPTYGEAQAALLAASLAASMHLDNFILEGDSSIVISSLQHPSIVLDWHIDHVITDTISLIPASSLWETRKVNRSVNFCAHHVAYRAAARVISGCIPSLFSPPLSIPICSGKDPPPSLPSL